MRPDDSFGAAPAFCQECSTCGYLLSDCECDGVDADPTPPLGVARWASQARHPSMRAVAS